MQTEYFDPTGKELIRRLNRKNTQTRLKSKPIKKKPYVKKQPEFLDLQKEMQAKKIAENKHKYKKVYDEFFERGGAAWFESLTGRKIDLEKIYLDIEYFIKQLEYGVLSEDYFNYKLLKREEKRVYYEELSKSLGRGGNKLSSQESRRLLIMFGTPPWADREKIKQIYEERDRIIAETGELYEVDHIIPVKHEKVCGLNVEFNLQILSESNNRSKSNNYEIG